MRSLHSHDLGSEVGEDHGRERTGKQRAEVQNAKVRKRSGHGWLRWSGEGGVLLRGDASDPTDPLSVLEPAPSGPPATSVT